MKFSDAAREVWKGALQALGALLLALVISWLTLYTPKVKEWVASQFGILGASQRAGLTIFLGVLSLVLLVLWIRARISLYRMRLRLRAATRPTAQPRQETKEIPGQQLAILEHLCTTRGDYLGGMLIALKMGEELLLYHLRELEEIEFIYQEGDFTGGKYKLWHDGRHYLNERGLLK